MLKTIDCGDNWLYKNNKLILISIYKRKYFYIFLTCELKSFAIKLFCNKISFYLNLSNVF